MSWEDSFPTTGSGFGTTSSITSLDGPGAWTVTITGKDGVFTLMEYSGGRLNYLTLWEAGSSPPSSGFISGEAYYYDSLGRVSATEDARKGVSHFFPHSDICDFIVGESDPDGRQTLFTYDHRGRRKTVNLPDTLSSSGANLTNVTTTTYFPDGSVKLVDGGQTYKTGYTYDYAGRMLTLTTYGNVTATTTWNYSTTTGQLTSKTYPDGFDAGTDPDPGPTYTYTTGGRLKKRIWARGNTTRYDYDSGGRHTHTRYFTAATTQTAVNSASVGNDPFTPDGSFTYDALGRMLTANNNRSSITYGYHPDHLNLATETISIDPDGPGARAAVTRTLERGRDSLLRPTGHQLKNGATVEVDTDYTWDSDDGRLSQVSGLHAGAMRDFNYGYELFSSSLPHSIESPVHTAFNAWDESRDLLDYRENKVGSTTISKYDYSVNDIGQRIGVARSGTQYSGGSDVAWGYDSRGQLVAADRSGGVLGDRGYKYDGIGNRYRSSRNTTNPDTATGVNLALFVNATAGTTPEGASALNQYRRTVLFGTLAVNQTYDADGNQLTGRFPVVTNGTRYWDGENRIYRTAISAVNTYFYYDAFGRRVAKYKGNGTLMTGRIYFYEGWNVAAECSIAATTYPLDRTYTWGTDLSGSFQGAGGVGGLLAVELKTGGDAGVYYPTYDGNGNVSEYLSSTGAVVAHYEYDPFGESVVSSGSKESIFTYRFSTKPLDKESGESGYYYYGHRFYDPVTGRWPSRDPIEEQGGLNLYGFADGDPISNGDGLGLEVIELGGTSGSYGTSVHAVTIEGSYSFSVIYDTDTCCVTTKIRGDLYGGLGFLRSKSGSGKFIVGYHWSYRIEATIARTKLLGINVDYTVCPDQPNGGIIRIPLLDKRLGANVEGSAKGGISAWNVTATVGIEAWGKAYLDSRLDAGIEYTAGSSALKVWLEGSAGYELNAGARLFLDVFVGHGKWKRKLDQLSIEKGRKIGDSGSTGLKTLAGPFEVSVPTR